jgi:hypothetical protein
MFKAPANFGFTPPAQDDARPESPLPALIATMALMLSIAMVLTAVTVNVACAAQLF